MLTWNTDITIGILDQQYDDSKTLDNFFSDRYDPTIETIVNAGVVGIDLGSNYKTNPGVNTTVEGAGGWPIQSADVAFANKYFKGVFPAKIYSDNTFVISRQEKAPIPTSTKDSERYPRTWLEVNPAFESTLAPVVVPLKGGGTKTVRVNAEMVPLLTKAFTEIKAARLDEYIINCGGGIAVRNVTNGARLSNHSWGFAIDLNVTNDDFPTLYKMNDGRFKSPATLSEFDKKYAELAQILVNNGLTWLKNFDPMHFSIHE